MSQSKVMLSIVVAGALVAEACTPPEEAPPVVSEVIGSVTIVTNSSAQRTVSPVRMRDALIEIGGEGPNADYFLDRVAAAMVRPDGTLLIGNSGTRQVLSFGSDGRLIRAIGREGDGPGEFGSIDGLFEYRGDSVAVFDRRLRRLSFFDSDLILGRVATLRGVDQPLVTLIGVLSDGSFVSDARGFPSGLGHFRRVATLYHHDAAGHVLDQVATYPGDELIWEQDGAVVSAMADPLSRDFYGAVSGEVLWAATSDSINVERLRFRDGGWSIDMRVRASDSVAYQAGDVRALVERQLPATMAGAMRERSVDHAMRVTTHDEPPRFDAMVPVANGGFWLRRVEAPPRTGSLWDVFDADGRWTMSRRVGDGMRVLWVGAERIVASVRTTTGEEEVVVLPASAS